MRMKRLKKKGKLKLLAGEGLIGNRTLRGIKHLF